MTELYANITFCSKFIMNENTKRLYCLVNIPKPSPRLWIALNRLTFFFFFSYYFSLERIDKSCRIYYCIEWIFSGIVHFTFHWMLRQLIKKGTEEKKKIQNDRMYSFHRPWCLWIYVCMPLFHYSRSHCFTCQQSALSRIFFFILSTCFSCYSYVFFRFGNCVSVDSINGHFFIHFF